MHSIELTCLELSVVLFIAHVLCQAFFSRGEFGEPFLFGARDQQPAAKGVEVGRATRALHNFVENYGAFLAMDLGLIVTGHTGGWGAIIWIIARIAYLPIYIIGTPVVRTACWGISIVGLLMMLVRLATS
jgi:uncharacterized MAPEG superfamily protein